MPGLPRKSTANQFKKLMRKSGKARTNKAAGGSDPSTRKIATYEQYCKFFEGIKWYSKGNFSEEELVKLSTEEEEPRILKFENMEDLEYLNIGDRVYANDELFGTIIEYNNEKVYLLTALQSKFIVPEKKFLSYGFYKILH